MSDDAGQPSRHAGGARLGRILREAGAVLIAGTVFALLANQFSPRGLRLQRNYFPHPGTLPAALPNTTSPGVADPAAAVLARLRANGLQAVALKRVGELYHAPQYEQEVVVFVDARDDAHYQAGHIPGAYQFDHYHPETYLPTALPVCQTAQQIVVYCTGGDCEDSEFAALTLHQAGVPLDKLFVFAGGFTEWSTNGLPVELGARRSGNLRPARP